MEALAQVGLEDRAQHYPAELSGGQAQRTAIARAIVTQPDIVLADEPTGNLDIGTRDQIMDLFRTLSARGTTLLVVTYDADVGAATHQIMQMRDGRLYEPHPTTSSA